VVGFVRFVLFLVVAGLIPAGGMVRAQTTGKPAKTTGAAKGAASGQKAVGGVAVPGLDARHAILLLNDGPVHLRLKLRIGGKTLEGARRAYAEKLLKSLDSDGNGLLTRAEAGKSPLFRTKQRKSASGFLNTLGANEQTLAVADIERAIERIGGEPVTYRQDLSGSEPDKKVFEFLDLNKNSLIEADEIGGAAERLLAKDTDGDQCVSYDEFAPAPVLDPNEQRIAMLTMTPPKPTTTLGDMLRDAHDPSLGRSMTSRYDKDRDRMLSPEEIHWPMERLSRLDENGDGKLDEREIGRWEGMLAERSTPDVDVDVDLAPAEGKSSTVAVTGAGVAVVDQASRADFVKVRLKEAVISISLRNFDPLTRALDAAMKVFNRLDADANGYLDRDEVKTSVRFERSLFELMDADGDDKLFSEEVRTYVSVRSEPAATACRVHLFDTGFGFFLALDQNGDGRISERERRGVDKSLVSLDRNGDQTVADGEPVRHFHLELARGTFTLFGAAEPTVPGVQAPAFQRRPSTGPEWFIAMDRNNDGDLSWEEFQASRQDFEHIDANGDELIDPGEAIRADEEYRKQKNRVAEGRK
jgi:Ca2+-binding EF-hand superfamily protein